MAKSIITRTVAVAKKQTDSPPHPSDLADLKLKVIDARRELGKARRGADGGPPVLVATLTYVLARLFVIRPVRVFQLYSVRRGPLMAAGIAYRMFFSIASLLIAGISILGLVVSGNVALQNVIVDAVASTTPGLIDTDPDNGASGGLVTADQLFSADTGLSVALVVSTIVTLITALGWIAGVREGMRGIFALPPVVVNPVLLKLKDLGTLLVLGVALVLTTVVGLAANTLLDVVFDWLQFGDAARPFTWFAGVVVMLVLDLAVAVILFRGASGIEMHRKNLFQAALIAAAGSTLLRTFSTLLLGNVDRGNALLAPFAVILGLFVWFFLLSQVYLLAAAWGAIGKADAEAGVPPRHNLSLRQQSRAANRS
ncbi:YihY/virulence factor BrkB family protein [Arthrobacter sp. H5]|uniref:YihY/virulence factor BrkB family protein n=1 Tax=Arthrobacter sp. H5 TaxID=1267973 RepID=UPI000688680E|nr:YihY/virulence factor BrkB family protein [Arthrobacter sp. H5]